MFTAVPQGPVRAWHTLDASKYLLKEFTNGDQPQYSIIMISCKRTIPYQIMSPLQVLEGDININSLSQVTEPPS